VLAVDVVKNRFIFSLFSICYLSHTNSALGAIELVEKLLLYLLPAINGLGQHISMPVERDALQSSDKLFH